SYVKSYVASQMELECAKVRELTDKLSAHQETISILSKQKEAQIKLYKTREDKEIDKVIEKAQRANPYLYDIGCYNGNLALMLTPDSDEVIRLEKESRSKLSDLIRPFDYDKLNSLYDLFVPQREKSSEQRYFLERSRLSHINVNNGKSKKSFNKQTTLLEKRMDESIPLDKQYSLRSQLETWKTQFLNEIDRLSKEYYYADHMNTILGVYTELDEGDRVLRSNSRGKKLEVEEPHRNVKLTKNKTSVTACSDSLNAQTLNVKSIFAMCAKCVMIKKHDLCVLKSVAKPLRKTVASESIKKPRNNVRKLHERFGKI
nr:hypothetical protein [Tanacetum cinerariifolium]